MKNNKKDILTLSSLLVALGIVYGDIGTSPLYVMNSMLLANGRLATKDLVFGGVSLVFWTLTLQTTIKYVILTLKADNNGEGGIFSLYTLVRKHSKWLIVPAMIGGAALLADGMITPPVSITSAIEGLSILLPLTTSEIILIVLIIIAILFFLQRFGTSIVGKIFGPIMLIWFSMLAILGISKIVAYPQIILALNPYYGIKLLLTNSKSVYILGAVFLCTTGAEALYSDLGHCGRKNIYYTWFFVKTSLVLNYLGQSAWLMSNENTLVTDNPFFAIMPLWFVLPGVIIATFAAIIASQALISGSFTLIAEAIKLNLFPRLQVKYPSHEKGQIYIPAINFALWIGCSFLVLYFEKSEHMEAAYGLSITVTMLMTTILLSQYIKFNKRKPAYAFIVLIVFSTIELSFLYANLFKFFRGGYITLLIALLIILLMYVWTRGSTIKQRYKEYVDLSIYKDKFENIRSDTDLYMYSTHLVYLTQSTDPNKVENKILFSIFNKQPKRAQYYWFVHVNVTDEPYTMSYKAITVVPNETFSIQFDLGFRVEQKINVFLRQVIGELILSGELKFIPKPYMINSDGRVTLGNFRFVLLEEKLSNESDLSTFDNFIMSSKLEIKKITLSPAKWFGIDTSNVDIETVPLIIGNQPSIKLKRIN